MNKYELIIEPSRTEKNYWSDLWHYRELFYILAWRDISVRYKQTAVGVVWALVRPFLTMLIFTVIFSRVAKLQSDGSAPYALLVITGMLPWTLFSTAIGEASNSLISNANLISKVYFPRLIVPTAAVISSSVDFLISLVLLFFVMLYYQFVPDWRIAFLPVFSLFAVVSCLGPALYLTALNVKYRDFRYIIPFLVQFGLYVSPVGFSSGQIPESWRFFFSLNPIVGVIDGFRWCLLAGESQFHWQSFAVSLLVTLFLFWQGLSKFRRVEKSFADIV